MYSTKQNLAVANILSCTTETSFATETKKIDHQTENTSYTGPSSSHSTTPGTGGMQFNGCHVNINTYTCDFSHVLKIILFTTPNLVEFRGIALQQVMGSED